MTSRIDIAAPATITVLAGNAEISSLNTLPPGGVSVTDPDSTGTLTVKLIAAGAAALSASGTGGATIATDGGTLPLTGGAAQVNAALASLEITEPAGAATDTILLTAADPGALPASTAIAIAIAAATGPAFANPPATISLHPNTLTTLSGLIVGDPEVTGLNQIGFGASQTLALTLSAASGILLLPGLSALDSIEASGLGTGEIVLTFTADRLAAVNALLAGLEFAGPAATSGLAYALRDVSGPLGAAVTSGNIALDIAGTPGLNGTYTAGSQRLILGAQTLAAGTTLAVTSTTGDLGGIAGSGAVFIAPDATLNLPYNALSLGGTSLDFGTLAATAFSESGTILIADGAAFSGPILLGTSALLDFTGTLIGDNAAEVVNELAISLNAGAVLLGNGTVVAGNFSESGRITGPGTLLGETGGTLLVAAGSIGGGGHIDVAAGGVVVLGPVDPLYGVFDATPLTIDSSVTLAFSGDPGLATIGGGYADALDQTGGVFVINGPEAFSGTITGFAPGDRLIFPGLTNISLYNITANGFDIAGQDNEGTTQTYIVHASYPAGTQPYADVDDAGNAEISLRDTQTDVFLDGTVLGLVDINATAGIAQPIQGLDILRTASSTLSYTVTLAVGHGTLTDASLADGTLGPAASLTITAATPTALNAALAELSYTGIGQTDTLSIISANGALAGLDTSTQINVVGPGTLSGFTSPPSAGQAVAFATASLTPISQAAAPGELIVTALTDFADQLVLGGLSGTALRVDAGATAIFDAAATVVTGAGVTIGDAGGAGTLAVLGQNFTIGANATPANLVLAGAAQAAGSAADISGRLGISGSLVIGASAAAALTLSGSMGEAATSLGQAGTLFAFGDASAAFGRTYDAGTIYLADQVAASASTVDLTGLLDLGGTATLAVQALVSVAANAELQFGPDALLTTATLTQSGGTVIDAGTLSATTLRAAGLIALTGGTLIAAAMTLAAGAALSGYGIVEATSLTNNGTILAANGGLTLGFNVANAGTIQIGASAALDAVHAVTGGIINFTGSNALLTIDDLGVFTAAIGNMSGHDVIDLVGIAPGLVTFAAGSVTAHNTAGNVIGGFALGTVAGQPAASIVSDGHGGALITLGDEMPCFARGTRLLTPAGYRPIESLKPGDPLITAAGDRRPVRWIGRRTLDLAGAALGRPVLITPGAFGPGQPARPLRLSPLHAVSIAGVLVPAQHLVNSATILREPAAAVTYFHIELDRHDVVLAEGLPCETYLDNGNRGALYHEVGTRTPCRRACAPRLTAGPKLAAIRRGLHDIALAAGFSLTYQPVLRALANGHSILPDITMRRTRRVARFSLPAASRRLTLLSRAISPADTDPTSEDRRELALCLRTARTTGRAIPEFGSGWYARAPADAGTWMGNRGELILPPGAAELTLTLAAIVQSWVKPVDSLARRS